MGHPSSWRLFRAHPALGLEEDRWPLPPQPGELGVAWLALDAAEQRDREGDLADALRAAVGPRADVDGEVVEEGGVLGVRMDRWKAPALERELLDRVHDAAQARVATGAAPPARRRRDLDRTLRAHVLVSWERHAFKAFVAAIALAGLLGLHPWGDGGLVDVAVRVATAVVVVIALGRLVERWYRRTQRAP